jgi:beta-glucosidase
MLRWGSGSNSLEFTVPPIDALRAEFSGTRTEISTSLSNNLDAALNAAADKDVAVVFVNACVPSLCIMSYLTDRDVKNEW